MKHLLNLLSHWILFFVRNKFFFLEILWAYFHEMVCIWTGERWKVVCVTLYHFERNFETWSWKPVTWVWSTLILGFISSSNSVKYMVWVFRFFCGPSDFWIIHQGSLSSLDLGGAIRPSVQIYPWKLPSRRWCLSPAFL